MFRKGKTIFSMVLWIAGLALAVCGCSNGDNGGQDGGDGADGGDDQPKWVQVGGQVSPPGAESEDPTMLVLGTTAAVGYRHQSFRTYLNVWDGSSWGEHEPDPSDNNTEASIYSSPDFCSRDNDVFMAYSHTGDSTADDDTFFDRVFVYRWTEGGGWQVQNGGAEVSVIWSDPPGGANAWEPAVACPASGDPLVAWVEADVVPDPDTEDGAWVAEVSASSSDRSSILSRNDTDGDYYTSVRTVGLGSDASGSAVVAQWEQDETEQWLTNLYVTRYSSGNFTNLGGSISDDWDSNNIPVPSLIVEGSVIYIAYSEANSDDNTRHVYVKKYDGNWSTIGGGPVSAYSDSDHYNSNNPDILMAEDRLWIAWQESEQYGGPFIFVAYWDEDGNEWIIDGDKLNTDLQNGAGDPSLAYSPDDGYLYVAFEENSDGYPHIFVKRKKIGQ